MTQYKVWKLGEHFITPEDADRLEAALTAFAKQGWFIDAATDTYIVLKKVSK
jgi:hypothetical protein